MAMKPSARVWSHCRGSWECAPEMGPRSSGSRTVDPGPIEHQHVHVQHSMIGHAPAADRRPAWDRRRTPSTRRNGSATGPRPGQGDPVLEVGDVRVAVRRLRVVGGQLVGERLGGDAAAGVFDLEIDQFLDASMRCPGGATAAARSDRSREEPSSRSAARPRLSSQPGSNRRLARCAPTPALDPAGARRRPYIGGLLEPGAEATSPGFAAAAGPDAAGGDVGVRVIRASHRPQKTTPASRWWEGSAGRPAAAECRPRPGRVGGEGERAGA